MMDRLDKRADSTAQNLMRSLLAAGMIFMASAKTADAAPVDTRPVMGISVLSKTPDVKLAQTDDSYTDSYSYGDYTGYDDARDKRLEEWIGKRNPRLLALRDKIDAGIKQLLDSAASCNEEREKMSPSIIRNIERRLYGIMGARGSLVPVGKDLWEKLPNSPADDDFDTLVGVDNLDASRDAAEQILRHLNDLLLDPNAPAALKHFLVEKSCLVS